MPPPGWNVITPVKGSSVNVAPFMSIVGYRPDDVSGGTYSGVKTHVRSRISFVIAKKSMSSKTSISPVITAKFSSKVIAVAVAWLSP